MKSFIRILAVTVAIMMQAAPIAIVGSGMAFAAIDVPDITTTDQDPGKAVKGVAVKLANSALLAITGIAVAAIMAFFLFLAAGKPFPRYLVIPAVAVILATSVGWLIKLFTGG